MQIYQTKRLNPSALNRVVNLHKTLLHESALNNFTTSFLQAFYKSTVENKSSIFLTIIEGKVIIGYLVCLVDKQQFYRQILIKNFSLLLSEGIRLFFTNPKLLKEIIFWPFDRKPSLHKTELQLIAIDSSYQGKGLGTKAIITLNKILKKKNIHQYVVGTKSNNKLSNAFYKKLNFIFSCKIRFMGDDFNYYISPHY